MCTQIQDGRIRNACFFFDINDEELNPEWNAPVIYALTGGIAHGKTTFLDTLKENKRIIPIVEGFFNDNWTHPTLKKSCMELIYGNDNRGKFVGECRILACRYRDLITTFFNPKNSHYTGMLDENTFALQAFMETMHEEKVITDDEYEFLWKWNRVFVHHLQGAFGIDYRHLPAIDLQTNIERIKKRNKPQDKELIAWIETSPDDSTRYLTTLNERILWIGKEMPAFNWPPQQTDTMTFGDAIFWNNTLPIFSQSLNEVVGNKYENRDAIFCKDYGTTFQERGKKINNFVSNFNSDKLGDHIILLTSWLLQYAFPSKNIRPDLLSREFTVKEIKYRFAQTTDADMLFIVDMLMELFTVVDNSIIKNEAKYI